MAADAGRPSGLFSIAFGPARLHFAVGHMNRSVFITFGVLVAAYCLSCWFVLETRNNEVPDGVLQQYHGEYADGGSKKWRFARGTDPRKPLHDFITGFGLMVYPVAIGGIAFFGQRFLRKQEPFLSLCVVSVCVATLVRFIVLGVLTAALEL